MLAVLEREFNSYFASPIGYVYLTVFFFFSGLFYRYTVIMSNSADLNGVFGNIFMFVMFLLPVLTMRLFSEDKKYKTDQALLTAPVSLFSIIMGKYFAAFAVYCIGIAVFIVYALVIAVFVPPDWAIICGNLIGILLLGAAIISICMFISALTETQVASAVGGFAVTFFLWLLAAFSSQMPNQFLADLILKLSFSERYGDFTSGILNFSSIVFYLSVVAVFIFLTIRVFEKRRWA